MRAKKAKETDQPMDRAFSILDNVVAQGGPTSVTEIASGCALPIPTVHRLVAQLERRGLLKRSLGTKKVVVGEALLRLGLSALDATLRSDRPHQIILALSTSLGEHVQVGLRSGNDVLYVDTARVPLSSPGLHFEQGRKAPLYCTSIGKLFLAEMVAAEFAEWLARTPLPAITPRTITRSARLHSVVVAARKMGWAVSNEEFALGVVGCAVPIRLRDGRLVAGLGLSVPSARMRVTELVQYRSKMEIAARAIASAIVIT